MTRLSQVVNISVHGGKERHRSENLTHVSLQFLIYKSFTPTLGLNCPANMAFTVIPPCQRLIAPNAWHRE